MALIKIGTDSQTPRRRPSLVSFSDAEVGSILFSAKDQQRIIDTVNRQSEELRRDVRQAASEVARATFVLAGALGAAVVTGLYLGSRK